MTPEQVWRIKDSRLSHFGQNGSVELANSAAEVLDFPLIMVEPDVFNAL